MISNQILATASSAVYHARAMQQADEAARLGSHTAIPPVKGTGSVDQTGGWSEESSRELKRSREGRAAASFSFGDIYSSSLLLSSVAFVQAFSQSGLSRQTSFIPAERDIAEEGSRQYRAAQERTAQDSVIDLQVPETNDNAVEQEILPPLKSTRGFSASANTTTATGSFWLQDEFVVARAAYEKASDFRQRAFASPPSINLLG